MRAPTKAPHDDDGTPAPPRVTAPRRSLEHDAFLALQRAAEQLAWEVGETLKPFGLTATQYNALRILRGAGADGAPCGTVSEQMITRVPDVTRLLDRLEAQGFVERWRGDDDRRVVRARITPAGLALLARIDAPVAELHQRQLTHLGEPALRALVETLERTRRGPRAG